MRSRLLKAKMLLYGDENFINSLAELLNITRQTASAKLNNNSEFTESEIATIVKHYHLTDDDMRKIFIEGDSNE